MIKHIPKILLVDDNISQLCMLEQILDGLDVECVRALSGNDALKKIEQHTFALCLLAADLPQMNGIEILHSILQSKTAYQLPVILISSINDNEYNLSSGMQSGAVDFITRPIVAEVLFCKVKVFLEIYNHKKILEDEIARHVRTETNLRKLSIAVEQSPSMTMITDVQGRIEYVNPKFQEITGYALVEIFHENPRFLKTGAQNNEFYQTLWNTILSGNDWVGEFQNKKKNGKMYWEFASITPLKDKNGTITHFLKVAENVTKRKTFEERLKHNALFDILTELPNRKFFLHYLNKIMARAKRDETYRYAVLFLDIDRFKFINDSLGHVVGDKVLAEVATRLKNCVRANDMVARFAGDEFIVLLDDVKTVNGAICAANHIQEVLSPTITINQQDIVISSSIGILLGTPEYISANDILRDADSAMYRAKSEGKACYAIFDKKMHAQAIETMRLDAALWYAIEKNEFRLWYQPVVSMKTGEIVGVEALIRWEHPANCFVPPDAFIPLAEERGSIIPIGEWVLKTAIAQLATWHAQGYLLRMAINLSAKQLQATYLANTIEKCLAEKNIPPHFLELELTETAAMKDYDRSLQTLQALRAIGVRISLDDFGTGYASLTYLKRFPINIIKIDRSFVRDIPADTDDSAIVHAIIVMAHTLGIHVIAEGVEENAQLMLLKNLECDEIQGYYFCKPGTATIITSILAEKKKIVFDDLL